MSQMTTTVRRTMSDRLSLNFDKTAYLCAVRFPYSAIRRTMEQTNEFLLLAVGGPDLTAKEFHELSEQIGRAHV